MTQKLTLVSHKLCPYVQRAAIALAEKGVPFERIDIDLDDKPDWFCAISPLGKVPLLRVENEDAQGNGKETILFESNVICEFIEDTQPGVRLHPQDATERARHRAWMEFGSAALADLWQIEVTQDAEVFEAKRAALTEKFAIVEAALGAGPYFAGESFGFVDAVFAPIFRYFDLFDRLVDLGIFAATPKVRAWRASLAERPSVRSAVQPNYLDRLHGFLVAREAHLLTRTEPRANGRRAA